MDQIIRDLVESALVLVKQKLRERNKRHVDKAVEDYILTELCGPEASSRTIVSTQSLQIPVNRS